MPKVCFLFDLSQKILLGEQSQNSIYSGIDDVKFAKQMLFIILINFPLTDEHMIERFLNEHMQNVTVLMFKKQANQIPKKLHLADLLQNAYTRNRYAMTQYLE